MKVLVCGQRDFADKAYVERVLDALTKLHRIHSVVHGLAKGADSLAGEWAKTRGLVVIEYPADWATYGKAAGPIRNRHMFDSEKPAFVIAFYNNKKESKGTRDMVKYALSKGTSVHEYELNSPAFVVIDPPDTVTKYRNVYNERVAQMWKDYDAVKIYEEA